MHWLIAFSLAGMLASGLTMTELDWSDPETAELADELYFIHKWSGFGFLALVLLRIVLAAVAPAPPLPAHVSAAEKSAARVVHFAIYLLLVATPVLGWAAVSAGGWLPAPLWGAVSAPAILDKMEPEVAAFLFDLHWAAAMTLAAIAALHMLAALSHLIRADGVFKRMWFPPSEDVSK